MQGTRRRTRSHKSKHSTPAEVYLRARKGHHCHNFVIFVTSYVTLGSMCTTSLIDCTPHSPLSHPRLFQIYSMPTVPSLLYIHPHRFSKVAWHRDIEEAAIKAERQHLRSSGADHGSESPRSHIQTVVSPFAFAPTVSLPWMSYRVTSAKPSDHAELV